jgi:hypothetical protein
VIAVYEDKLPGENFKNPTYLTHLIHGGEDNNSLIRGGVLKSFDFGNLQQYASISRA